MISIARLEGFYWVATTGGYARAARAFPWPITQPAVHQQVKKLEREVGTALFSRVGKDRVVPTAAGRHLLALVEPMFAGLPATLTRLRQGGFGGPLRLCVDPLVLRHLLPPWLRRLRHSHPDIAPELHELEVASTRRLQDGEFDAVLGWLPELGAGVAAEKIAEVFPVVVLPAASVRRRSRRFGLAQLRELPFLGYPEDSPAGRLQRKALRERELDSNLGMVAGSAETILALVGEGLGWSVIPWLSAAGPRHPGVFVWPLRRGRASFPISLAWRQRDTSPLLLALRALAPGRPGRAAAATT